MDIEAERSSEANFQNLLFTLKAFSLLTTLMGISKAFFELIFLHKIKTYSFAGNLQNFVDHFFLFFWNLNFAHFFSVELEIVMIG